MTKITSQDLSSLMDLFEQSEWVTLHLQTDESEIYLSKDPNRKKGMTSAFNEAQATAPVPVIEKTTDTHSESSPEPDNNASETPIEEGHIVRAPSLGTFYRSPKPGASPYIELGDNVTSDSEICLIEVMKLFTTMQAGTSGKIIKIFVNDGELVEHNQPLFLIKTDESSS